MRRILAAFVALACVALLSSCSAVRVIKDENDPYQDGDAQMQHIADAVKDHDAAALEKLFSLAARQKATDLDGGVKYLLSQFPSGWTKWVSEGDGTSGSNDSHGLVEVLYGNYEVFANGKKYDLYFADFTVDQGDPNNVGIYALGAAPHDAHPYTRPSASSKAFDAWASQFDTPNGSYGDPGVYVPQN
jgi:hypothetical protein